MNPSLLVRYFTPLVLFSGLLAGISASFTAVSRASTAGFVRACGTTLCLNGRTYRFDGFNMYYAGHCGPAFSKADLAASLADQRGGGVFRMWAFENDAYNAATHSFNWAPWDNALAEANAHGFKVIMTLDNQWGDCVNSGYKNLSWWRSGYKRTDGDGPLSYRAWVKAIVSRYAGNRAILAWQMINEGEAADSQSGTCEEANAAAAMKAFTGDIGGLIHSLDPGHLVSLGTMGSGQCGTRAADYKTVMSSPGTNLCEYHDYGSPGVPMPGDRWNGLRVRLSQCAALGKPLFVGETGIQESQVGSYAARAADFNRKFSAQDSAGVTGELIWSWNLNGSDSGWDVGPGDPSLSLLSKY